MAEMRQMRVTDVANIVAESTSMRVNEEPEDEEATSKDFDWLNSL